MPITENEKNALAVAGKNLTDKELPKLAALIYESIQKGGFSAETLATFGKQFFAGIPWADIPGQVKLPLFKGAINLGENLADIFEVKSQEPRAESPEQKPEVVAETVKVEAQAPLIPEPTSNGQVQDSETGRPEGVTEDQAEAPKAQA